MIKTVSDNTKSQSLCPEYSLLTRLFVNYYTWQVRHFGNPTTILFSIDFDLHSVNLRSVMYQNSGSMNNTHSWVYHRILHPGQKYENAATRVPGRVP